MSLRSVTGIQFKEGSSQSVEDELTVEELLSISVNGEAYTITMRSPGFEEDLVRGILLTEDVYSNQELEPDFIVLHKNELGFITEMNVKISSALVEKGIETKRNLMSVTSCGMCGKQETQLELGPPLDSEGKFQASLISNMFSVMSEHQKAFKLSGGSHASAAFNKNGELLSIREDIGRHNAVDKVIGSLLRTQKLSEAQCLIVSGRVSYEIVSKAYKAGIPFLAAVSAPSSMAVRVSEQVGITLMAFCRENKFTAYSNSNNLVS